MAIPRPVRVEAATGRAGGWHEGISNRDHKVGATRRRLLVARAHSTHLVLARESERIQRTGESFRTALNRLLRRGARAQPPGAPPQLPELPGGPTLDVSDVSALLAALDDERRAQRGLM